MRSLLPADAARGLICAQGLFAQMLAGPAGHIGRGYLEQRYVSEAWRVVYGLGYGLAGYSTVLAEWGVSPVVQHQLGLLDDRMDETMVDRITFPWLSPSGKHVIGIGGRSIRDGERRPKYDNTPQTEWFTKGRAVFGLAQASAAIHGAGWALVQEGPFDAMATARMGWTNSVATVGAKITVDQLLLVARLTDDVVVMLDADEGGRRGRSAVIELVERHWLPDGLTVHTATLYGAKDAASPECTMDMVADAIARSLPVHR